MITPQQLAASGTEHDNSWQLISYSEAKEKGLKYYFTGDPCKRGHVDRRFVSSMVCVQCGRDKSNEYYRRAIGFVTEQNFIRRYGFTAQDLEDFKLKQDNKCAICNRKFEHNLKPHVDHDHKTGEFRAILCSGCNTGLGNFKENIQSLERAIEYLRKHDNS